MYINENGQICYWHTLYYTHSNYAHGADKERKKLVYVVHNGENMRILLVQDSIMDYFSWAKVQKNKHIKYGNPP